MFETTKENIKQLRRGKPGSRFREFCEFRQERRQSKYSPMRVFNIVLGLALVVGGASIGWLPGPGGFVAIFGLALLAQEFRSVAVVLDWCELKLRAVWDWALRTWRRLSGAGRVAVAMTALTACASVSYATYSLLVGN